MLNVFKTLPEAAQQYRLCRQSPQLNLAAVQELALYGRTLSLVSFRYSQLHLFHSVNMGLVKLLSDSS